MEGIRVEGSVMLMSKCNRSETEKNKRMAIYGIQGFIFSKFKLFQMQSMKGNAI